MSIDGLSDADIRAMVGERGEVRCVEILEKARKATADLERGRCGKIGTWRWDYTRDVPDGYFDCVAALQSVQHCDDWREAGADLLRVMKPGRRLVLAEVAMFGTPFWPRLEADLHLQYWIDKLSHFRPLPARETAYYSPEELHTALDPLLESRGEELAVGIERAAAFLQSASRSAGGIGRIFTTGGGARIPRLNKVLSDRLRIPVQLANPIEKLQVADGVFDALAVDEVAPLLMLPIGLALRSAA